MVIDNKRHWYDGWIYDRILAPHQKDSFSRIASLVKEGSDILDIGCGTGRLVFRLAPGCRNITGIDLSAKNIATAKQTLDTNPDDKINFVHSDIETFVSGKSQRYNYSILSYVLHELNSDGRMHILKVAAEISDMIIISDHFPSVGFPANVIREILEMGAGPEHYSNYRNFVDNGGIQNHVLQSGLSVLHEEVFRNHLHIAVVKKM